MARSSILRRSLLSTTLATLLFAAGGCSQGDPKCSVTPQTIEFPLAQALEDTLRATFTVENVGDGDRMSWFVEPPRGLGLRLEEPGLYVLDAGQKAEFTLVFAPTDSIPEQTVPMVVGIGDCTVSVTLGALAPPDPGACCLPDGSCVNGVMTAECEVGLGGSFQGESTLCADVECPQPPSPVCEVNETGFSFVFDATNSSEVLSDTLVVRNTGAAPMIGTVARGQLGCGPQITVTALENIEPDLSFEIAGGDSALVLISATISVLPSCIYDINTNADATSTCPAIAISTAVDFSQTQRAARMGDANADGRARGDAPQR